jgi:DNA-binding HxlR family transcriptional regulator
MNMNNLQIINPHFIIYADTVFTIDVLGGVDLLQIERMICTLRITHKNYPQYRTTLDLYNDNQTDKLIRTLCDKWSVTLMDVSKSVHAFICQLESYKLERLRYPQGEKDKAFEMSGEEEQEAKKYLSNKNLIANLKKDLEKNGILGEEENALILFLAMASHKSETPFSVLCLAKSGIGKSYLLQKLSECMPKNTFSFHTQISENALYYFDNKQIDGKTLFIEDLEWTNQMLMPLATLQTQGKLIKTRATKDKDGMLHSTTFEVSAKLCLIACAYSEKNYEQLSLPFLCLHLNHSHAQDINVMEYQKKCKAGLINQSEIAQTQRRLQCVIASLKYTNIINPFAPLIHLPEDLPHPRKTLLLLLNFIDTITFFRQYQRETTADQSIGEVLIKTHPEDIELAFDLLKNCLFRRADELSTTARGFYNWLKKYLTEAKTNQFTALDVRKAKRIHPRTLNRYLQELALFNYIQVTGGNKYREGYQYKITNLDEDNGLNNSIETALKQTLENIRAEHSKTVGQNEVSNSQPAVKQQKTGKTTPKSEKTE